MLTIMGAGGNTGGKIARSLLALDHDVRAISRSFAKLAPLAQDRRAAAGWRRHGQTIPG